jgi:hypothetical protein
MELKSAEEINLSRSQTGSETDWGGSSGLHPSRSIEPRMRGYGIGGGYERPYRKRPKPADDPEESYGPLPHSGYYGAGGGVERFKRGEAGYSKELSWYSPQYGERTIADGDTNK